MGTEDITVVAPSRESRLCWDKQKIVDSLKAETTLADSTINSLADTVETKILDSNLKDVSTVYIRELLDTELIRRGLKKALDSHSLLGMPVYDMDTLLFDREKENANTTHNPESVNLTIAENMKKQYALRKVFSEDIANAHLIGDIHIHDLGFVDRPYCGGHSLEYIKKYGLRFPAITSASEPAKHADVLVGHMVKMAMLLQSNYAGAVGWEAVNVFFAPYLRGMDFEEIKQIAQMLIFEFNQLAGARGGQVVFSDFNLYYGIPRRFRDTPAIGPGGCYRDSESTGRLCYKDFEEESNLFLKALLEVYMEGDADGKPFFFPKPLIHINDEAINTEGWDEIFAYMCEITSENGALYFVFDRGDSASVSQCCRLQLKLDEEDLKLAKTPEKMRFTALQNVTINLPRLAYKSGGDYTKLKKLLKYHIELVGETHLEKRRFVKKLLALGDASSLIFFLTNHDGEAYLKFKKMTCLCGLIGLNECVEYMTGKQLHESKEAYDMGLDIVGRLAGLCAIESDKRGFKIVLEETPAESTNERLVNLDKKYFPDEAAKVIKGKDKKYYTNSVHFAEGANIDVVARIKKQSKFHPLVEAGSIIHVWLGEAKPHPKSIMKLLTKVYTDTECSQLCFSPEFTICYDCHRTTRGLKKKCGACGGTNIYGITRIVGYYSAIPGWNAGKLAELKDRRRETVGT
jgi:ribonucleoside-triphosphate reductase